MLYLPTVESGNAFFRYWDKWTENIFVFLLVMKSLSLRPVTLPPTFELRPFGVKSVVDKRELEQISLRVLWVYAVSAIPPVLRKHLHLQRLP